MLSIDPATKSLVTRRPATDEKRIPRLRCGSGVTSRPDHGWDEQEDRSEVKNGWRRGSLVVRELGRDART